MSGLGVGGSPGASVAMEPVRNPAIPLICYGNQRLDLGGMNLGGLEPKPVGTQAACGWGRAPGAGLKRLSMLKLQFPTLCEPSTETCRSVLCWEN